MKILTILGARPQFIKASVVSREFVSNSIQEIILHTGQHFDVNMSDVFFTELKLPASKYNLNIHGLSHGAMTGRMIEGIESILIKENPDILLVYGDTNSTLAGALAATKLNIKIAHVEAGLRSFNNSMPEEINRILTDRISDWLFCPSQTAMNNLNKEGLKGIFVGDVMLDVANNFSNKYKSSRNKFVLATIHRQENTDAISNLTNIIDGLNKLNKEISVVAPMHPRTKERISKLGLKPKFKVIDPVGYIEMSEMLKSCSLVITDSGGLQKEAYFHGKPCVTMREETEWTELVENGFNMLSGSNSDNIYAMSMNMIEREIDFSNKLYGDGQAAKKIVNILTNGY